MIFISEDLEPSIAKKHLRICSLFYHCTKRSLVESRCQNYFCSDPGYISVCSFGYYYIFHSEKGQQHLLLTVSGLFETCLHWNDLVWGLGSLPVWFLCLPPCPLTPSSCYCWHHHSQRCTIHHGTCENWLPITLSKVVSGLHWWWPEMPVSPGIFRKRWMIIHFLTILNFMFWIL